MALPPEDMPPDRATPFDQALMQMRDLASGFVDLAAGVRRGLVDSGFDEDTAGRMAAEYAIEVMRTFFDATRQNKLATAKPPTLGDIIRRLRPPE
jgi:hypothetical protein